MRWSALQSLTPLSTADSRAVRILRSLDAIAGARESSEFLRQSKTVAEAWHQGMAHTRYEEIAGTNHFTVIDPLNQADSGMTARVAALAYSVQEIAA